MRFLPPLFGLSALVLAASPAAAQTVNADTYKAVIAHGVVIVAPEMEIDVTFTPDGKFTAFKGISTGVWRIDGEKLCSTPNETMIESCSVYPAGKKSGDTFDVEAPGTRVTIRIR
jgi:phage gp45-like